MVHHRNSFLHPRKEDKTVKNGRLELPKLGYRSLPSLSKETCRSVSTLMLNGNEFVELPDLRQFSKLATLNMMGNRVAKLSAGRLPPTVRSLDCTCNELTAMEQGFVAQLPMLNVLILQANHLSHEGLSAASMELSSSRSLTHLDLASNQLSHLPFALPLGLLELNLNLNPLAVLPSLAPLRHLHVLRLAGCRLSSVPDEIFSHRSLSGLDLGRNLLSSLPAEVTLPLLVWLNVHRNLLTSLPASLRKCAELRELEASHNSLAAFPDALASLPHLERLRLEHNAIAALTPALNRLASRPAALRELHLSHNAIASARGVSLAADELHLSHNPLASLAELPSISCRSVCLAALRIDALPPLAAAERIDAPANLLSHLPWRSLAASAASLRFLNLSQNRLAELPAEMGRLAGLKELLLGYNLLQALPPSCGGMRALAVLHLGGNRFAELPEVVCGIPSLQWLHAGNNHISSLPDGLHKLHRLQSLALNDNHLTSLDFPLPAALLELDVSHNLISSWPPSFTPPSGAPSWYFKSDEPPPAARGGVGCCLGARGAEVVLENEPPPATHRTPRKMPRKMQPFRAYVHGNAMGLPPPRLVAHRPGMMPAAGVVPPPIGHHPRGSGLMTIEEYDGCLWPSECALVAELCRAPTHGASTLRVGVAEMMGRRLRMEDAVVVDRCFRGRRDEAFLCVLDGHSGSQVCEEAAARLGGELAARLGGGALPEAARVFDAMREAYLTINERFKEEKALGGSTAVAAVLRVGRGRGELFVSNVGDARGVLCRRGKAERVTRDFKPFDDDEYERIVAMGGFVSLRDGGRLNDDLALSRSLGDRHLGKLVEPLPHTHAESLDFAECPFLIVACDGVWDVLSDQQAVDAVLACAPRYERGACALRDLAFLHGSEDNISALVVDLTSCAPPPEGEA